jgi:hypothetical protein
MFNVKHEIKIITQSRIGYLFVNFQKIHILQINIKQIT